MGGQGAHPPWRGAATPPFGPNTLPPRPRRGSGASGGGGEGGQRMGGWAERQAGVWQGGVAARARSAPRHHPSALHSRFSPCCPCMCPRCALLQAGPLPQSIPQQSRASHNQPPTPQPLCWARPVWHSQSESCAQPTAARMHAPWQHGAVLPGVLLLPLWSLAAMAAALRGQGHACERNDFVEPRASPQFSFSLLPPTTELATAVQPATFKASGAYHTAACTLHCKLRSAWLCILCAC